LIAEKRVIVGATAIELGDRYTIPRFGTVPGVIVQALAAESLIQHRALKRLGFIPTFAGLLAIALLIASGLRIRRGAAVSAGVLLALVAIPVLIQAWVPLSIDTAPLLFASLGGVLLRAMVEARHRIRVAAIHDVETGLPNEHALEAVLLEAREVAVTAASIERFEIIRDAIGTVAVAEMIARASARIEEMIFVPVHRVAPDTLAWINPPDRNAEELVDRITKLFAEPVLTESGPIDVQWTFGIASTSGGSAIEKALSGVNVARKEGRTASWYTAAPSSAVRDLSIMGELRRGLDDGQLFVLYQPKLALKTGAITHAEALVRWQHPVEGLVSPDRFLPLAEETGAVRDITWFVLRRVLADMAKPTEGNATLGVSINVSAADIIEPSFADEVIRAVTDAGIDPTRLTLEITESAIIRSKEAALQVLERLRAVGVKLSIDDYGTGQSTLSYVKALPVQELKIDKTFVTSICHNHADRLMVRSTIELAHALGLTVVAEGVEDWNIVELLTNLGCDYAQGFAIGRGLSIDEFRLLASAGIRKAA
jgi:EAL domain-containing protein (putative c-di-GMP-specific phosphodiesterase class I)/GGDEF domain-containing protein